MEVVNINIVFGFLLIFVLAFLLATVFYHFYTKYILKEVFELKRLVRLNVVVALCWVFSLAFGLMFFSGSEPFLFILSCFLVFFVLLLLITKFLMKLGVRDVVLYSLVLAIIMSPAWYFGW